ncbi:MAG: FAD-dependent oxidoreductase, partial [Chloroflexi bacterium]|nr:FAD-dependent oxidoreductase [Chloroflexota bacterium]
ALRSRLGAPLYALFYGPYAEKVWGLPGEQIAAGQAERRVNQRGLMDLLRQAAGRGSGRSYYYPRGGFGRIAEAYGAALDAHPAARVVRNAAVEAVRWSEGRIVSVQATLDGAAETLEADHLVWTAPLPELVRRLDPSPPPDVPAAAAGLRQRAVVLCYVVLNRPRVGYADTYYFPEGRFPFNRVTEQKNFSDQMAPPDRTVLCMDLACDPDDTLFACTDAELAERVLPALEAAGLAQRSQVIEVFSRRFRNAYPLYDHGHAAALQRVQDWLAGIANLWMAGRQGLLLHNNTHHSLLMGYRAADAIAGKARAGWPDALDEFAAFRVAD